MPWDTIKTDFEVLEDALTEPWRWRREGRNEALGEWLVQARKQLEETGQLVIANDAPVTWLRHDPAVPPPEAWAMACRTVPAPMGESVVAILQWPSECRELAKRLGGRWPIVERSDDADLLRLGARLVDADGPTVVEALVEFVSDRMTAIGPALRTAVDAIRAGRGVSRITKNREHADRLSALATNPTPANALAWLEGVLAQKKDWWLYRRECVYQLREALRHCTQDSFVELPDMVAAARIRARHRGRLPHRRSIGTPLLVKGLEFDHAVLLWEPNPRPGQRPRHPSMQGLYVALTRASKSLTIVSKSRILIPEGTGLSR